MTHIQRFLRRIISRTICLSCLLATGGLAWAAPWGLIDVYLEESPDNRQILASHHEQFAMYHFLTGKPILYTVSLESYPAQTPQTDQSWKEHLTPVIEDAFDQWPAQTRAWIAKSGREKEFKDITRILSRSLRLEEAAVPESAHISFKFTNHKGAAFTFNKNNISEQKQIRFPNPAYFGQTEEDKLPKFAIHEVGHYYGLGDRYQDAISGNSPTYSSTGDTDGSSVMASSLDENLSCEDVDGFINLIDITHFLMKGKWSKRANAGWKSLCTEQKIYRQARELNRQAFFDGRYIYYYNPDGTIKKKEEASLSGRYNPLTQPQAAQGPFTATRHFTDSTAHMQTHIHYEELTTRGYFSGTSTAINLTMLHFEGTRKNPYQWQLNFTHTRNAGVGERIEHPVTQHFDIAIQDDICQVQSAPYALIMPRVRTQINEQTQLITGEAQISDERDKSITMQLRMSGTRDNATYVFTSGSKTYQVLMKDSEIYWGEQDLYSECEDLAFYMVEAMHLMDSYIKDAQPMCRYISAVEKQSF